MEAEALNRFLRFEEGLDRRSEEGRRRTLEHFESQDGPYLTQGGRRFLNFASNDYLGLATDPDVRNAAASFAREYGSGSGASRLIVGGLRVHETLERELAHFTRRQASLLFNSGYQANASVIPALVERSGVVICDRLSHNSILQGGLLSGARLLRFGHNDPDHLNALLVRHAGPSGGAPLVVTESIFSMNGDRAPLAEIARVADRHGAILMVDDAHAIGLWGRGGEGLAAPHERVDVVLGTFGKAFGASGAFVACTETVRDHLVNFCGGFIYSTAPPPATIGAVSAALRKVRSGELDQEGFLARLPGAHARFREAGFDTSPSDTQVVPIPMEGDAGAVRTATRLRARGIIVAPIRPPTVPEGGARLRVSLTRLHTEEHVTALARALADGADGAGS